MRKGRALTGPNPVDRGKKGSKLHVLSEAQGIPLAVAVSSANTNDTLALKPLIRGMPAIRSRRGPRRRRPVKLRADKAYFSAAHLAWLRERGIVPRIARPGADLLRPAVVTAPGRTKVLRRVGHAGSPGRDAGPARPGGGGRGDVTRDAAGRWRHLVRLHRIRPRRAPG